jgi:hypothetical protein
MILRSVVVLGAVLIVVACSSGGGSSDGSKSPCEIAGEKICQKACGCGTNGECITGYDSGFGVTKFTWSDSGDCTAGYSGLACSHKNAGLVDWVACQGAVDPSSCTDGTFVVPKVCDPPKDGGS